MKKRWIVSLFIAVSLPCSGMEGVITNATYQPFLNAFVSAITTKDIDGLRALSAHKSLFNKPTLVQHLEQLSAESMRKQEEDGYTDICLIPRTTKQDEDDKQWTPHPVFTLIFKWDTRTGGGRITHPVGLVDGQPVLCDGIEDKTSQYPFWVHSPNTNTFRKVEAPVNAP